FGPFNNLSGLTNLTIAVNDNSAAGDFSLSGNTVGLGAGGLTATIGSGSTLATDISYSGAGGITLGGGGTMQFNNNSSYTGGTTLNGGTLVMGTSNTPFGVTG